jgi:hypothetical protein
MLFSSLSRVQFWFTAMAGMHEVVHKDVESPRTRFESEQSIAVSMIAGFVKDKSDRRGSCRRCTIGNDFR